MRFLFIIPDLVRGPLRRVIEQVQRRGPLRNNPLVRRVLGPPKLYTDIAWGGTLNIMRHAWVARRVGAEVALLTPTGRDTYGAMWGLFDLPYVAWADRRPDDVVMVPDYATELVGEVEGRCIVYQQVPIHLYRDFDYMDPRITMWTDSPHMLALCEKMYPGKEIPIVPNVVDNGMFPFIPQREREEGLVFAFPRKGPEYIAETRRIYRERGGTYWTFELIDGIPVKELAQQFKRPQAFLASAEIEGCALPPQESMAAGVVVIGRKATGANFAMDHGKTALVAETPADAAQCLLDAKDLALRERLAEAAHAAISRYFPDGEPTEFWAHNLERFSA